MTLITQKTSRFELNERDLSLLEEVKITIDTDSFKVYGGVCPQCKKKLSKVIVNEDLFQGAVTIHLIKFRCETCKKEYLDLEQAQKYDLFISLKKLEHQPISNLTKRIIMDKKMIVEAEV